MTFIEASDGCELYYEDFGTGRPIVFVHGGGATHGLWDSQVATLADRYRTVCYDLRGVGKSSTDAKDFSLDRSAADLCELIDALDLHAGTIVTHGFGGHITLRAFRERPRLTERLVLVAAAPWFQGGADRAGGFSHELTQQIISETARSRAGAHWHLSETSYYATPPEPWVKIEDVLSALQWPSYVLKQLLDSLASVDHTPYLSTIAASTLVLHGRHDHKNRFAGAAVLQDQIPNARLVVFDHSAHTPFVEEPDRFSAVLDEFLTSR